MEESNNYLVEELDRRVTQLESQLRAMLDVEHNENGTHGEITVEGLDLQDGPCGEVFELSHDTARYNFFGGIGWTVSESHIKCLRACRIGQLVFIEFILEGTNIETGDSVEELYINLPEFHAMPNLSSNSAGIAAATGMLYWTDPDNSREDIGLIEVLAESFTSDVPATLLVLRRYSDNSDFAGFAQWSETTNLTVRGSVAFLVNPDNQPRTFYGV